ncbi:hypothetical protein [Streptosporangium sp. NPDC002721]|uniref:hypothetical protein n=1 Tax=Streptosporangium sp. NPDC002721 TaxID=3366188 RepID=UPI0036CC04D4
MEQQAFCNRCGTPVRGLSRCPGCGASTGGRPPLGQSPPAQPSRDVPPGENRVPPGEWRQDPADWQQHLPPEERPPQRDERPWRPPPNRGRDRPPRADRKVWPLVTTATVLAMALAAAGAFRLVPPESGTSVAGGVGAAASGDRAEAETGTPSAGRAPQGPQDAETQARVLDALLADSGGSRSGLGSALGQLRSCEGTATGLATLQRITAARREQVVQVGALSTGELPGGDAVKARLTRALTASFDADEAFLAWATRQEAECDRAWSGDADYRRGLAFSGEATTAKRGFLRLWNPLARRYGLPVRAEHEI